MKDFEDQLREALRAPDVPAGFANRVLARLPEAYPAAPHRPMLRRVAIWAAAVLVCAVSLTGCRSNVYGNSKRAARRPANK